jgi:hypothetical protein
MIIDVEHTATQMTTELPVASTSLLVDSRVTGVPDCLIAALDEMQVPCPAGGSTSHSYTRLVAVHANGHASVALTMRLLIQSPVLIPAAFLGNYVCDSLARSIYAASAAGF